MLRPLTEAWGKDLKECRMCPVIDLGRRRVWRGKRRARLVALRVGGRSGRFKQPHPGMGEGRLNKRYS